MKFSQSEATAGPEGEIFPKSNTEFFPKLGGQITFVKESGGKVVKIIGYGEGSDLVGPPMNDVVGGEGDPAIYESLFGNYDCGNGAVRMVGDRKTILTTRS